MNRYEPAERDFLLRFNPGDRGPIGHFFHAAVRAGCADAGEVVAEVRRQAEAAIAADFTTPGAKARARGIIAALRDDPSSAREYSQQCLQWGTLSRDERVRLKAEKSLLHRRAYMASLPVTARQQEYLSALGCREVPRDRLHASELIDALRGQAVAVTR